MNIKIMVDGTTRDVTGDFKIYGSKEDLMQIANDIQDAVFGGLAQGWVGVCSLKNDKEVFPNNGAKDIVSKNWKE